MKLFYDLHKLFEVTLVTIETKCIYTHDSRVFADKILHIGLGSVVFRDGYADVPRILLAEHEVIRVRDVLDSADQLVNMRRSLV